VPKLPSLKNTVIYVLSEHKQLQKKMHECMSLVSFEFFSRFLVRQVFVFRDIKSDDKNYETKMFIS